MHGLLNDTCELIKTGRTLQTGQEYAEFLESYMVQFLEVDKSYYSNYLNYCNWFYQNQEYPALQLVWPDGEHMFPWDSQYNPELKFKQPLLDRNTDFKFYEERNLGVFTTKQVLDGDPILYAYHNEDGDWQFHSEDEPDINEGKLVSLEWWATMDPSINEVFHLPYGRRAWRRQKEERWEWD